MEENHVPLVQRIIGLSLVITGFLLMAIILNPKGLVGPPISDRISWLLISCVICGMISFGGYLVAGYDPRKGLEVLIIGALWVLLILPIFYLPLSEDTFILALGCSPFLALLLWIGYTKLKEKLTGKREAHNGKIGSINDMALSSLHDNRIQLQAGQQHHHRHGGAPIFKSCGANENTRTDATRSRAKGMVKDLA